MLLRAYYAMPSTRVYAMPGTELAYGATRRDAGVHSRARSWYAHPGIKCTLRTICTRDAVLHLRSRSVTVQPS
eukprot:1849656-Rhodomonas_salina.3